jgi:hypothetical protein
MRRRTDTSVRDGGGPAYPAHRPFYGPTRATVTLVAAAAAGLLVWLATQIGRGTNGGYWAAYGLIAAAGLVMALSQLLGGWTKWGFPRISGSVFLLAFVPVLVVAGWVLLAAQPDPNWFRDHVGNWSGDIHVRGLVHDLTTYLGVLAFGIGLVFGYTFDTSGPRLTRGTVERRRVSEDVADERAADEPLTAERGRTRRGRLVGARAADGGPATTAPDPEPAPRTTRELD